MAARFAVATGNWTAAIWAATSGGAAGSAAVPTNADDATINKNVTVTINDTTAVALTLTLSNGTTGADVGAILTCTTAANWKLTLENGLLGTATTNPSNTATYGSSVNFDMTASSYLGEVVLNNANSTTDGTGIFKLYGSYQLKGAVRKRHTVTTSALVANTAAAYPTATTGTWCEVSDATGWAVGDRLVFATTEAYNATPKTDVVTIATITATTGTAARITWTDGTGTSGSVANPHASGCPVGNLTSNLVIRPATDYYRAAVQINADTNQVSVNSTVSHVLFSKMRNTGYGVSPFSYNACRDAKHKGIHSCAFYEWSGAGYGAMWLQYLSANEARTFNIFFTTQASSFVLSTNDQSFIYNYGPDEDYAVFRATRGIMVGAPGQTQRRHKISGLAGSDGVTGASALMVSVANTIEDCSLWSNYLSGVLAYVPCTVDGCSFDSKVFANATTNDTQIRVQSGAKVTAIDCSLPASETIGGISSSLPVSVLVQNRDGDAVVQEFYQYQSTTIPAIQRNVATINRSTSSMEFTLNSTTAQTYAFEVLAKAGETIRLMCYVKIGSTYDDAAYTYPSITVSGLGITPVSVSATAASVGAWELLTLDATNTGSADGNLTVTLSAQSATANAKAYFSGLPASPFVSRCRHYGYLFNETSPTRTVDPLASASFATADAYTGMAITWGASASSTAITTSNTFQKLFDYHQAKATQNVGSAVALTGAGAAGSPALFAAGNVTISDGAVLNGSGSISMDAYTLATEFASGVNYTYTGGTFSQATTVPTFSGGTLNIGAAGTYTYTQAAAMILSMTPTAPGTYALGATTFTGQVDLRNTAAHAITVELPTGTSYTTASNTGGAITVSLPTVTANISITGLVNAGAVPTRLQIYNSTALTAASRANSTAYVVGNIRLRQTGIGTENTAGLYLRCTTAGTSAAAPPVWNTTVGGTTTDGTAVWTTYAVLFYDADPAATSYSTTYIDGDQFLSGEVAGYRFAEMNNGTSFKLSDAVAVVSASGFSILAAPVAESVFATNAIDGATYESTFSPNFTSNYIVLDSNTDFSGKAAYAYYCYTLTTSDGMWRFWGGVTAVDEGNYRINTSVLNLYFDESAGFVKQTDSVRIFRSDGTRPALDPTTGGNGIEINWRTPVNVVTTGGSALTAPESAQLMALPSAAATATAVWSKTLP